MLKQVLLVEDDAGLSRILTLIIQKAGYQVTSIDDGHAAIQYLNITRPIPDVLVLDMNLPGITGFQILDYIRKNHDLKAMRILGMTANPNARKDPATELADEFLMKPVNNDELVAIVKKLAEDPA